MKTITMLVLALVVMVSGAVFAGQSGDFTYTTSGTPATAQITDYTGAGGAVSIPDTLEDDVSHVVYSVTSIGGFAFDNCSSLTSVTIPSSVTSIGSYAFSRCTSLTSVVIPDSVSSIVIYAFSGCSSLTSISVSSDNLNYSSEDGVLFDKGKTILVQCPGGKSGDYTIPDTVTNIREAAFSDCSSLTSVVIPNSVTSIGNSAFHTCSGLTSVTIPSSVTSIGVAVFHSCSSLTSIIIPNSVTNIGESAFSGCSSLASIIIPESVTNIGKGAFASCTSLTSIIIPKSVASIGDWAFYSCLSLTSISVSSDNLNYSSEDGVLFDKGKTALVQCPGGKSGDYIIPNTVTSIGYRAFMYCSSLTSVVIPNSVTSIGGQSFVDCTSLTSITIGSGVTSIGDSPFDGYGMSLTSISVSPDNLNYSSEDGVLFDKGKKILIRCPQKKSGDYIIPNTVTSIGNSAVNRCTSLTSVTIPSSVTSIGDNAFFQLRLTSITIPGSVTSIGVSAFGGCYLTSIVIPSSVTSIGGYAFYCCWSLTRAYFLGNAPTMGNAVFDSCASGFTVNYKSSSTGFETPIWKGYPAFPYDYVLFYDSNGSSSGTVPSNRYYLVNATVTVSSNTGNLAKTSCTFEGWNTQPNGSGTNYVAGTGTFTITADTTLYANFAVNSVAILTDSDTINVPEGATNTFQVKLSTQPLESKTVTVLRNSGDNDITVSSGSLLTFSTSNWGSYQMVTLAAAEDADTANGTAVIRCSSAGMNDKDVTATKVDNDYMLTINNDGNGTTAPSGDSVRTKGTAVSIGATANTGYHFLTWSVTSGSATFDNSSSQNTTITALVNATICATFAINTFTLISSVGLNGSITPSATVDYGTGKTFTITPSTNYHVADVLVDGESVGAVTSYAFEDVTANHTISATFTIDAGAYSISGTVEGAVQQGVTLILSGTDSDTTTSGADGTFTFAGKANSSYTVTLRLSGYTFAPSSRNITVSGNNVTGCDFVATKNPGLYSISGTVSGAIQEGITITLSGALSSTTPSGADGTYSFTGLADGSYTVTPSFSGYTFAPFSQDFTIAGANQSDINFTATAISIFGQILKPSFNASYKDSVKKIVGIYTQYSTEKFTIQATIQFPETFVLTNIGEDTGFTFDFGLYSFSGTLGNAFNKKLDDPANGGSATFKITGDDAIKGKKVTVEKVDLRWDKKKILTVKITGTPASNSNVNVVDLSGKANGPVTGNIDTFVLTFSNAGANFAEGESLAYSGKKNSKTVIKDKGKASEKTFTLVDWSAKGKK